MHAILACTTNHAGILNRAYAKTVKLNRVKPTQERSVEKPRAPARAAARPGARLRFVY
jgi:hypothetical protein